MTTRARKHGGARSGAGRPREHAEAARAVTVRLDAAEDRALTALECEWRVSGSEALRRALQLVAALSRAEHAADSSCPHVARGESGAWATARVLTVPGCTWRGGELAIDVTLCPLCAGTVVGTIYAIGS